MGKTSAFFAAADRVLLGVLKFVTISLFCVLTAILSLNIVNRFLPFTSFHWLDEIVELCFAGLVFYGAAAVWMRGGHFSAGDWISARLGSPRAKGLYRAATELAGLLFVLIFFRYSWQLAGKAQESTAVFQIPKFVLYSCMPVSAAIMTIYSAIRVVAEIIPVVKGRPSGRQVQGGNQK